MTAGLLSMVASLLAYEAGTHARLTAGAAAASHLHETLREWGLKDGAYQTLRLDLDRLDRRTAFAWRERLARVDPAWGGAADPTGAQRAMGWVVAGSVLEETPASRGRHHFLDPRNGSGLAEARPGVEWLLGALAAADGEGSLAGALAGSNFSMVGEPADRWILSPRNEWGLPTFDRELRAAMLEPDAARRSAAMARALLALGAVAHVLQDMASPTHVRNDLWVGHLGSRDASAFDRSSHYERFVEATGAGPGRWPAAALPQDGIRDRFHALAAATQRAFYSPGTLPAVVHLFPGDDAGRIETAANAGASYPEPTVAALDLDRATGYAKAPEVAHLVAWRIDRAGNLRFDLDERCYADAARVLLPWAGAHTTALLLQFVRSLDVRVGSDGRAAIGAGHLAVREAAMVVFWEDAAGTRHELQRLAATSAEQIPVPEEAVRLGAWLEGKNGLGEPIVAARVIDL